MARKLSLKMRTFCLAFVGETNGNGTEAAKLAGYKGNEVTLAAVAYENLRKPQIVTFIEQLRVKAEKAASDKIMTATEVKVGLTRIAEADIADVFESNGTFNLVSAKKRNVTRLIKTLKFDKDTGRLVHLELHNAHTAHQDMGKTYGIFVDKVETEDKTPKPALTLAQLIKERTGEDITDEQAERILAASVQRARIKAA